MRLKEPRIDPLDEAQWEEEARELIEPTRREGRVLNIFSTLARHPKLLKRWLVFGNHILNKSSLPARDREIVILRVGWLCRGEYEWGQHVRIAKGVGLSDAEIERVAAGPEAAGWDAGEAALLRAVDELHKDSFITDATWTALAERYDTQQLMDLLFTVGQYNMLAMALNSLGVQREEGVAGFPDEGGA